MPASLPQHSPAVLPGQQEQLQAIIGRVWQCGGFFERKLREAGFRPGSVPSLSEFLSAMPMTSKEELVADHLAHPPFGSHALVSPAQCRRFSQTSGTSNGTPLMWLDTAANWQAMLACWRRVFTAAGLRPGEDRIFFAFSFGPFLGFWTAFEAACEDYLCIPGGGMSTLARLELMARSGVTVLCCTPTYAQRMGEQLGQLTPGLRQALRASLRTLVVAGEPGGSVPEVREAMQKLWGARVFDHHGMTEVGPVTYEDAAQPLCLRLIEEAYLAEVLDPATGLPVADGQCGELVLSTLARADTPLLRYRTGDLVRSGRDAVGWRFEGGILGRLDDMLVVRGQNVYPSAIEAVVRRTGKVGEFLLHHSQVDSMAELELFAEPLASAPEGWQCLLQEALRDQLGLRIEVRARPQGSLPRSDFKTRRICRSLPPSLLASDVQSTSP